MGKPLAIWKYEAVVEDEISFDMPRGAKVLSAGTQSPNKICLWALVDPMADKKTRRFLVRGTGHPVPRTAGDYVGTAFDGEFVRHVFEAD